jgi:hypothetical protein
MLVQTLQIYATVFQVINIVVCLILIIILKRSK